MFPIRSPDGAIIGFIGRAPAHADVDVPKYLNTPATVLYDKARALFGLSEARPALAEGRAGPSTAYRRDHQAEMPGARAIGGCRWHGPVHRGSATYRLDRLTGSSRRCQRELEGPARADAPAPRARAFERRAVRADTVIRQRDSSEVAAPAGVLRF